MKHKIAINRWSRTLTKSGSSHNVTIPVDVVKQWELQTGEELVMYQLDGALLILPLERVLQIGEPALLKPYKMLLHKVDHWDKCTA